MCGSIASQTRILPTGLPPPARPRGRHARRGRASLGDSWRWFARRVPPCEMRLAYDGDVATRDTTLHVPRVDRPTSSGRVGEGSQGANYTFGQSMLSPLAGREAVRPRYTWPID